MNKQINQFTKYERIEGEIIRIIKLDIRIGDIVINDQFEWDINNPGNSVEAFAQVLCSDLGLDSEFILPIAHSIREQILDHQKTILNERRTYYQVMYNNYRSNMNTKKQVDLNAIVRDIYSETSEWQPVVKKISQDEIKKYEKKEERKIRYVQRKK